MQPNLNKLPWHVSQPRADMREATAVVRDVEDWSVAYLFGPNGPDQAHIIVNAVNAQDSLIHDVHTRQPLSLQQRIDAAVGQLNELLSEAHVIKYKSAVSVQHATNAEPTRVEVELRRFAKR